MLGAIAACLLASLLTGELIGAAWNASVLHLPPGAAYAVWPVLSLSALIGVAVGTFIARGRFLVPALVLWASGCAVALAFGYRLQLAAVPMSLTDFLAFNLPSMSSKLVASACGLLLGRMAYIRWGRASQTPNNSSKPTPLRGAA
jgi:hypothetical protein